MTSLLGPGALIPTAAIDRNGLPIPNGVSGAPGTRGPILRTNPARGETFSLNFTATGTNVGDAVIILGSNSAEADDFQTLGTIILAVDAVTGTIAGKLNIDTAWERVYAQAAGGNGAAVTCQVVTNV